MALLSLSVLSLSLFAHVDGLISPFVVSAVFALVVELADVFWRKVARKGSVDTLATFLVSRVGFPHAACLDDIGRLLHGRGSRCDYELFDGVHRVLFLAHRASFGVLLAYIKIFALSVTMKINKMIMKQIRSLLLLLILALMPVFAFAGEAKPKGEELNISEIVLEHLSDSYEWHIAHTATSIEHITLPIIPEVRIPVNGTFCTEHSLPENYYFDAAHHGSIYEKMPDGSTVRPLDLSITKAGLRYGL